MPVASAQIAEQIRIRIIGGEWAPGTRIPDRRALAKELHTCLATVQDAVTQMAQEGFLCVGPRKKGTYVAENPPHLSRYRLIFPFGPDDWGQFWHALETAANQRTTAEQEFLCFYGLSGHRDIAEYQEVVDEVRTRRVAGLIFASSSGELVGTPLLEQTDLPRVAIAAVNERPGIPKVQPDLDSFLRQAVDCLVDQGRRRIGIICASSAAGLLPRFRKALAEHGLQSCAASEQFASLRNPLAVRHLVELMLRPGQPDRPDGLIIADDNLITAATEGIAAVGMSVPDELAVVGLTNFPNILPSAVALVRIGFDVPALLDTLVLRLRQLRGGESSPEFTRIAAVRELDFPHSQVEHS